MGSLDGRVAIVTGAGGGIGAAVAKLYAQEGAAVVVNDIGASLSGAPLDDNPGGRLVKEIEAAGGRAIHNAGDISDSAAARELIDSAIDTYGRLDILTNVAGILRDRMIFNMTDDEWNAVIKVHLTGHFNTIRPAAAYWRGLNDPEANHRIINYTSRAGLHGAPGQPNYSAAKMGIVGLTYSCAVALRKYGVTTNAISPAAATRMTDTAKVSGVDGLAANELSPDNIAPLAAWLASADSAWCNGHILHARGLEVSLYSDPQPLVTVKASGERWDPRELGAAARESFKPITDVAPPNPFV